MQPKQVPILGLARNYIDCDRDLYKGAFVCRSVVII